MPKKNTVSRPAWFSELTAIQIAIIDSHLLKGETIPKLVDKIQKEWKVAVGVKRETAIKAIMRYKNTYIVPQQAKVVKKLTSDKGIANIAAIADKLTIQIDPIEQLSALVKTQTARVHKLAAQEDKLPTLMDSQTKNITALVDMLFKLAALQMDLGILNKVATKHEVAVTAEHQLFLSSLSKGNTERQATVNALKFLHDNGYIDGEVVGSVESPSVIKGV